MPKSSQNLANFITIFLKIWQFFWKFFKKLPWKYCLGIFLMKSDEFSPPKEKKRKEKKRSLVTRLVWIFEKDQIPAGMLKSWYQPNAKDTIIPFSAAHLKQFTFQRRNLIATKFQSLPVNTPAKNITWVTHACYQQVWTQPGVSERPSETSSANCFRGHVSMWKNAYICWPLWKYVEDRILAPFILSWAPHNY
jgi:hypothetical protein